MRPRLAPVLIRFVGRDRLARVTENYEKQAGHNPDGTSTQKRSTGVNAGAREPIDPRMPNLSPA